MLNFGIIGTSWITEAYVDGALDSGLWKLTAIYSRNWEKGMRFGQKYGVNTVYTDLKAMATSDIDAVYIASPNFLHVEHALTFLRAGKHVICEKPLAAHSSEVRMLQEEAKKRHLIFLEAIMFMHLPARKLLDDALTKIGKITLAKFDFCQLSSKYDALLSGDLPNIFNPKMETGALMDLGIYCIYPALYLFGEPEDYSIHVNMLPTGVDGSGVITLIYHDKLVSIPYSKTGQAGADSDIQGDKGTIAISSISKLDNIEVRYSDGKREKLCGEEPKYKLMGYEAIDFYRYITDISGTAQEYENCSRLSLLVADYLEKLRKKAGITFPSDR